MSPAVFLSDASGSKCHIHCHINLKMILKFLTFHRERDKIGNRSQIFSEYREIREQGSVMSTKSKYKTKQREILLDYLKTIPGVHFTAGDICEYFKGQDLTIGQSTVYRQLEELVNEGLLNKYNLSATDPACFEYLEEGSHCEGEVCFHCKCEKCGKLIHMHCDELVEIQSHLLRDHQFTMDPLRTVFYGICEDCKDKEK